MSTTYSKPRLVFDPSDTTESDNIGAYLRDAAGNLLTSTLVSGKQALDVNIIGTASDGIYAEDSTATDAENLVAIAAVRQDALSNDVTASGGHGWTKIDSRGALWTAPVGTSADGSADTEQPVKVGAKALAGVLAATAGNNRVNMVTDLYRRLWVNDSPNIAILSSNQAVDNTAAFPLPATALAGRRRMIIQNNGTKDIYIGATGVTAANGAPLARGASMSLDISDSVVVYGKGSSVTASDIRILELA